MRLQQVIWLVLYLIAFSPMQSKGQNNPATHDVDFLLQEVALLSLASESPDHLTFSATTTSEAGNFIEFSNSDNYHNIWINYSSIIRNETHKRKIMVSIDGEIPAGLNLALEATEATTQGKGDLGKTIGKIKLNNKPQMIISDIGSCYTGRGIQTGHLLKYIIEPDNYTNNFISAGHTSVNVIYTLTDQN